VAVRPAAGVLAAPRLFAVARNGKQSPPRPQIEIQSAGASPEEAAAIAAALERFLRETAPVPHAAPGSRWQEAALREGVSVHSQLAGGWGSARG
jgi:hypothetical protein